MLMLILLTLQASRRVNPLLYCINNIFLHHVDSTSQPARTHASKYQTDATRWKKKPNTKNRRFVVRVACRFFLRGVLVARRADSFWKIFSLSGCASNFCTVLFGIVNVCQGFAPLEFPTFATLQTHRVSKILGFDKAETETSKILLTKSKEKQVEKQVLQNIA